MCALCAPNNSPEDAGPLAHNVRPDTYLEINNFYTATIYEKGAEIIRMLKVLIGDDAFRKGMDLYFDRYDGTAATIEDFMSCFAETFRARLDRIFALVHTIRHPARRGHRHATTNTAKTFTLDFVQFCKPTPGQEKKEPFVIPIALGLVVPGRGDIELRTGGSDGASAAELSRGVIELSTARRRVTFRDVPSRPVPSLSQGVLGAGPARYGGKRSRSYCAYFA